MGIMLVYDITDEKSFENIKNWIRNIEENASANVEKMLLGNKCELNEKRQVIMRPVARPAMTSFEREIGTLRELIDVFACVHLQVTKERGEKLAVEYGIKFVETSAKASINVEEAFYTLASDIKAKMEKQLVRTAVPSSNCISEKMGWAGVVLEFAAANLMCNVLHHVCIRFPSRSRATSRKAVPTKCTSSSRVKRRIVGYHDAVYSDLFIIVSCVCINEQNKNYNNNNYCSPQPTPETHQNTQRKPQQQKTATNFAKYSEPRTRPTNHKAAPLNYTASRTNV